MNGLFSLAAVTATALLAARETTLQAISDVSARQVYGHWQVIGVAVPDEGVQALVDDDPSYMGRRLTFTPDRLAWDDVKDTSTEAPCLSPAIVPTASDPDVDARQTVRKIGDPPLQAFSIRCAGGSWGPFPAPAPTIMILPGGKLAMRWYDNGLLELGRVHD